MTKGSGLRAWGSGQNKKNPAVLCFGWAARVRLGRYLEPQAPSPETFA